MTPGVDASAGSLGQGLSIGIGMAIAAKLDGKSYHTFVLLGDGECDEGQVWEAALAGPNLKVDNLTAVVDYNKLQLDGFTKDIMNLEPFIEKWKSFKWNVIEIDGHKMAQIVETLLKARNNQDNPTVIIAHTIKGKGVSFMENNVDFHGRAPNKEETEQALKELA
jgi:transketolase